MRGMRSGGRCCSGIWGINKTPEERVGALVWRMHRSARVIFTMNFHLGKWTPQQCVQSLIDNVGFEPDNAAGEVRRSFDGSVGPLYQSAYLMGALQFRALHKELVGSKKMTEREFADAVLHENSMPIEMLRADLEAAEADARFQDGVEVLRRASDASIGFEPFEAARAKGMSIGNPAPSTAERSLAEQREAACVVRGTQQDRKLRPSNTGDRCP